MKPNHLIICLTTAFLVVLSIDIGLFCALKNQPKVELEEENFVAPTAYQEIAKATVVFVGDIMLGRGVEYQMKKKGDFYPFEKIHQFLKGFKIVFGNLEGPIVEDPPYFSDEAMKFAFKKEVAKMLAEANFNLLSLANNHTDTLGEKGLEETRAILKENGVNFVGEPWGCNSDFSFKENDILFLSFNKTFPFNCQDEAVAAIVKREQQQNPADFLVVSLHWGEEYQLQSSIFQQDLAHKIIEAGADLVIGSHPHVVQEIELYQGKPIFYSLGNFIFDQYFSKETQQGLAVGVELYSDKVIYRLFPIQNVLAKPFLMPRAEAKEFLEKLAQKSSPVLFDKIKKGIIETE